MVTAKKALKTDKVAVASAALSEIVKNPTIDLTPVKKTAKTATFTGSLTAFGLMTFPVKTFKATDTDSIEFNTVHACTLTTKVNDKDVTKDNGYVQLKQGSMHCPACNKDVENGNKLKGFNLGNEKAPNFIVVTKDEIDAQKPAKEEAMNLSEFVDVNDIDPIFYESTEFIAPDKGGEKPFALLLAGMKVSGKVAKGVRVKGGREQVFIARPYGTHGMALSFLYADYEVRSFDKWQAAEVSDKEVELAVTLIERYEAKFTPATEDRYNRNVRRMIESKAAGVEVKKPELAAIPSTTIDLMAALQASLANAPASKKAASGN